ncbi:MAG TPA: hypothetical protein DIT13_14770 [Verrucomicrobiales bacterium]|nr:hypothetical protein [Verrucomicrobiales bacterium]HRJ08665.1 four helix bundle protein [Prosthecobacter sp.]HRK13994.1 four helix bundle protein [Prosthecobacter sp.]
MAERLHHEDLRVYQKAVAFVAQASDILEPVSSKHAVKDQLLRAAESMPLNIAVSNASQSQASQKQALETAFSSAAECAACLDVLQRKQLIAGDLCKTGKLELQEVFHMLMGLWKSKEDRLCEDAPEPLSTGFSHEKLECYGRGLHLIGWVTDFCHQTQVPQRSQEVLDRSVTSLVLNLAEGNARWALKDRAHFFDLSVMAGLRFAATQDILVARSLAGIETVSEAKREVAIAVRQILGIKRKEML